MNKSLSRRNLLQYIGKGALVTSLGLHSSKQAIAAESSNLSADNALKRLIEGNARYVKNLSRNRGRGLDRAISLSKAQHPFAVILGCADSRVTPALIFDRGLGDLFAVRVAGNIADDVSLGSIEYAVSELDVSLIMVLGHSKCGAVTATLEALNSDRPLPGHLNSLTEAIAPAIKMYQKQSGDSLDLAVRANIKYVTEQLKNSEPILATSVDRNQIEIVGAYYNLDNGVVEIIA
jgi:carbonic anhydrase